MFAKYLSKFYAHKQTDDDFRCKLNSNHHHVQCDPKQWLWGSPLPRIRDLDVVRDVVLDPMHLLHLGILRRLVFYGLVGTRSKPHFYDVKRVASDMLKALKACYLSK